MATNNLVRMDAIFAALQRGETLDETDLTYMKHRYKSAIKNSLTDHLTGLPNRRHFYRHLNQAHARALRRDEPVSVLYLDVDDFKQYNTKFGEVEADKVLTGVGDSLNHACRLEELVGRLGGEEFGVVLERADPLTARHVAERYQDAIGSGEIILSRKGFREIITLSVSIGIGSYPNHGNTPDEILRAANLAMREAKATGKSRIVVPAGYQA